jgi:hypothetical protein
MMQKGYCLAMAFRRKMVSSSGWFWKSSSFGFFERGCLTILAVGKAVRGELTEVEETGMGFIR